jgi:hypothetical protein
MLATHHTRGNSHTTNRPVPDERDIAHTLAVRVWWQAVAGPRALGGPRQPSWPDAPADLHPSKRRPQTLEEGQSGGSRSPPAGRGIDQPPLRPASGAVAPSGAPWLSLWPRSLQPVGVPRRGGRDEVAAAPRPIRAYPARAGFRSAASARHASQDAAWQPRLGAVEGRYSRDGKRFWAFVPNGDTRSFVIRLRALMHVDDGAPIADIGTWASPTGAPRFWTLTGGQPGS